MISDKLIELKILLRRACMCEGETAKKSTLNLRTKVLFLLKDRPLKVSELIPALCLAKPNATALARSLEQDGLIEKARGLHDRREVTLSMTDAGRAYLARRLEIIESGFKNILTEEKDYEEACDNIDEVIGLLSFLG